MRPEYLQVLSKLFSAILKEGFHRRVPDDAIPLFIQILRKQPRFHLLHCFGNKKISVNHSLTNFSQHIELKEGISAHQKGQTHHRDVP